MLLIREVMYCKPGKVRPMVEKFLAMSKLGAKSSMPKMRVMTDFCAERYWTIVAEMEVPNLQAFEAMMQGQGQRSEDTKELETIMRDYHELVEYGRREILQDRGMMPDVNPLGPGPPPTRLPRTQFRPGRPRRTTCCRRAEGESGIRAGLHPRKCRNLLGKTAPQTAPGEPLRSGEALSAGRCPPPAPTNPSRTVFRPRRSGGEGFFRWGLTRPV